MTYNCNWILALTSVCLVGLAGWTATRPDACDDLTHVFHNGSMHSCLAVTDSGFQALGSIDDCPNDCDRRQYKALGGGGTGARRLEPVQILQASSARMACPGFPYYHAALQNGVFGGCLYGGSATCTDAQQLGDTFSCACWWTSESDANKATEEYGLKDGVWKTWQGINLCTGYNCVSEPATC